MKLKIGTYNLRMSYLDNEGDNIWSLRRGRLMQSIKDCDFDVWGVQEVDFKLQTEIMGEFGHIYDGFFFSPYAEDGKGNKCHGILVKKDLYSISNTHFFWAGENPHTCCKCDNGAKGNYNRGGCCAVITHKESQLRFFLMCTHACYNPEANSLYANIYEQMEKEYNPEQLPSFFIGDMNATPEMPSSILFRKYWKDTFLALDSSQRSGNELTYTEFKKPDGLTRIDYIYYRGECITPLSYHCENKLYEGKFASDHFPVTAFFDIL